MIITAGFSLRQVFVAFTGTGTTLTTFILIWFRFSFSVSMLLIAFYSSLITETIGIVGGGMAGRESMRNHL